MRLPVGESDFEAVIKSRFDFVDKSLFIKEIIDDDQIILITRPRRFGKTLNLSMLQYFFVAEAEGRATAALFNQLAIKQESSDYLQHQGKYAVISFSFKDIKEHSFASAYAGIREVIKDMYSQHDYLLESEKLSISEKSVYQSILNQEAVEIKVKNSLKNLIKYLYDHHNSKVVVLIDEYDTPIQSGYLSDYYDDVLSFFRGFFGAALKDNKYIFKAVLTGILRIAKENLFSGLNNLVTYSMIDSEYGAYFGFTEAEVTDLMQQAGLADQLGDVKRWYNGYKVGDHTLYNPWSIASYIKKRQLQAYWVNTSDNALVKSLLINSNAALKRELEVLLTGGSIKHVINDSFVFADLTLNNEASVWNLLLMSGYLRVDSCESTDWGSECDLSIPNMEVYKLYKKIVEQWLTGNMNLAWYRCFLSHLLEGEISLFEKDLQHIMEQIVSVHDTARDPEAFYHGLVIGLTASLHGDNNYELYSNRESGDGRYDYFIISRDPRKLSILMEFKKADAAALPAAAQAAVAQIDLKNYLATAQQRDIIFSGKMSCM